MGKDKTTTQEQTQSGTNRTGIDQASQDYITNFLRPLGQQGAEAILGQESPFFNGPTDEFLQGLGGLQGVLGALQGGGFNQDLQNHRYNPQGTGFTPGEIGDGGAMALWRQAAGKGNPFDFNAGSFDPNRAQAFFSPFESQVVGGIQANADRQRDQALSRAAQEATGAGAFGGSRSAMLQSQALRDVNQDEASQVANVRNQGFQNAMQQALQAFGTEQATGLGAAQGRAASAANMLGQGLSAARLGQQGQIAQNELGLRNAMANMQDRQFGAGNMLQRALGLQQGNLQGLAQQQQAAGGLMSGGEALRNIQNQQGMEQLFRYQQALGLGNAAYGGPLGSTSSMTGSSTNTETQQGDLFGDLLGAGLAIGGMFLGGPAGAAAGSALAGGMPSAGSTVAQAAPNLFSTSLFPSGGGGSPFAMGTGSPGGLFAGQSLGQNIFNPFGMSTFGG